MNAGGAPITELPVVTIAQLSMAGALGCGDLSRLLWIMMIVTFEGFTPPRAFVQTMLNPLMLMGWSRTAEDTLVMSGTFILGMQLNLMLLTALPGAQRRHPELGVGLHAFVRGVRSQPDVPLLVMMRAVMWKCVVLVIVPVDYRLAPRNDIGLLVMARPSGRVVNRLAVLFRRKSIWQRLGTFTMLCRSRLALVV